MSVRVPVAPSVLEWALERSGQSTTEFEKKYPKWQDWVSGACQPTIKQVQDIASCAHVPFGTMFLHEPPRVELPIPDFRMGPKGQPLRPSQELLECIYVSQQRQAWFRDYAANHGLDRVSIVGQGRQLTTAQAAGVITQLFDFEPGRRPSTREDARNHVRRTFESLGGLIVFAGVVGNNTHRRLDREEFKGFTLADDLAPFIFVNASDSLSAQLFTFFHEFAHVLRAESGVSDDELAVAQTSQTDAGAAERWCNIVAAEVLVPADDLRQRFDGKHPDRTTLDSLSSRYLASTLTVLIRLRDLGLVPSDGFDDLYAAEQEHIQGLLADGAGSPGGGNHWNNQPFRVGERLARTVIYEVHAGRTSFTEAFHLLAIKNAQGLWKLGAKVGVV